MANRRARIHEEQGLAKNPEKLAAGPVQRASRGTPAPGRNKVFHFVSFRASSAKFVSQGYIMPSKRVLRIAADSVSSLPAKLGCQTRKSAGRRRSQSQCPPSQTNERGVAPRTQNEQCQEAGKRDRKIGGAELNATAAPPSSQASKVCKLPKFLTGKIDTKHDVGILNSWRACPSYRPSHSIADVRNAKKKKLPGLG